MNPRYGACSRIYRAICGRGRQTTAGLTLIELMIAVGVLTIGLTGLMGAMLGAVAHQQYAEAQTVATNHARDLLEQLLAVDETGEGAAYGMIELWADVQAGNVAGPPVTLQGEAVQVQFYDPAAPTVALTQADMVNRWRPIVAEVTVNWVQGRRPVQIRVNTLVNPDPA